MAQNPRDSISVIVIARKKIMINSHNFDPGIECLNSPPRHKRVWVARHRLGKSRSDLVLGHK